MKKFRDTDYYISENGDVFRFGKKRKPDCDPRGYCRVSISKNGISKRYKVHRLVAELYVENPQQKEFVNHIDGNPSNNHFSNLEWVTAQENSLHATRVLKKNIGMDNNKSKLTPDNVRYIRENCIPGHPKFGYRPMSRMFGVYKGQIKMVMIGKTWIHVL
jgi:hypothetical protein